LDFICISELGTEPGTLNFELETWNLKLGTCNFPF